MKRVAVLGGGPAGSAAAARLASAGLDTILLDEKLAWEKPCGGGITCKAYQRYPFLLDNEAPRRAVTQTTLSDARGGSVTMTLRQPMLIYSRYDLNAMLLERAGRAGARIEKERVTGLERTRGGWQVRTRTGLLEVDSVVVATGARNSLRTVGTEYSAADTMFALGYFVPAERESIDIQFFENFEGYLWVFPRKGHLSVGICGKGEPARALRARLEKYMDERGISREGARFYGHALPALERPSWGRNRLSGDGWLAVGDAAGLVDPVTGEGLYYAVRSGDLAAETLLNDAAPPNRKPSVYRTLLQHDFMEDLAMGAAFARRFFLQRFLFSSVPARMIEIMRRSPRMMEIVEDLFSGTQGYLTLKQRLQSNLNGTAAEIVFGTFLRRRVISGGSAR